MKGFGWLVILFALLTVTYLVVRDLEVLQGTRGEHTVLEPMEIAKETAARVTRTQDERKRRLDALDE
ncbi:MAG: hypothetical protein SCH98_13595 [Deferrisomatales bacterium]|nr:hypothetical protein [Deferrisomatales bacterium]